MQIDVTALRYAVVAAATLSFARAAAQAGVKQATLSRRIADLEARLGLKLFDRSTTGVVPTLAGIGFIDEARRLLSDLDNLERSGRAIGAGQQGRIGIGFSTSLAAGHLRALISEFVTAFPDLRITGLEGDRHRLLQALRGHSIDFAVTTGELSDAGIDRRPLWSERIMAALHEGHRLAGKERIYWSDLRPERFVLPGHDPGLDLADLVNSRLSEPGFHPAVETHEITPDNIINMISLARYITITTDAALGRTVPGVVFREIHDANGCISNIAYAGFWGSNNPNPALASLLQVVSRRYPV